MNAHIVSLQQQVNELWGHLQAMRNGQSPFPIHPSLAHVESPVPFRNNLSPTQSRASHPQFQGPTSSAFNLSVAKSSLQTMGITQPEVSERSKNSEIDPALDATNVQVAPVAAMVGSPQRDPLWQLSKADAIRLCRVYDEEMGMMYPMLDIEKVIRQAESLFNLLEHGIGKSQSTMDISRPANIDAADVNILRMVLASALMAEGGGTSSLGRAIYESCRKAFECKLTDPPDIKGLILLVIVAEFYFQEDEEVSAYRVIGLATRLCLEMGLHRRQNLSKLFSDEEEVRWAIRLFWSIYVLDRRWSFGTGMPFALQDGDIDPALPKPEESVPYLTAMISYSRISAKIWRSSRGLEGGPVEIDPKTIDYLDSQVLSWHDTIPESLRFDPRTDSFHPPPGISRGQRRLHIILYFRTNQMRTLIYRPVLHSATTIMEHRHLAQVGVDVAKDTISVLTRLSESTDIYTTQQVCFNYFLLSALAVIFLAVSHAPVEFSHQVQDEFYQALDIVKGFSDGSYIAKRLWKAISGLKEVGPKLGLVHRRVSGPGSHDPHSSTALAMASLAGHRIDERPSYGSRPPAVSAATSPVDGQQMSSELTSLFEAAKGYGHVSPRAGAQGMEGARTNGFGAGVGDRSQTERLSGVYGNEGEFSRIMGDLF